MPAYVVTKPNCAFCVKAKNLLDIKGIPYTEALIEVDITRDELLALAPTARTFPQVWLDWGTADEEYIGGADALAQYFLDN